MTSFVLLSALLVQTAGMPEVPQPLDDYTVSAVGYVLLAGLLITVLLIGAFIIVNLSMMSKRPEDRVGRHSPSEIALLKSTMWPDEVSKRSLLPAEEEDYEGYVEPAREGQPTAPPQRKAG